MSSDPAASAAPHQYALSDVQLAERWGVSQATVVRLRKRGELSGSIRVGRQWRTPIPSVEAFERGERGTDV